MKITKFSSEPEDLQRIDAVDITNYLALQTSYNTKQQMKADKSLESYNFFVSGWVNNLGVKRLQEDYRLVFARAAMWHRMWQRSQQHGNHSSRPETPFTCHQGFPLADPPAVKELVRAEVKMLLQTLREAACREGRDLEELLFRYKPGTVNYALGHQDICYSNRSNSENMKTHNRPSSQCSVQSSFEEEIEEIRDKLNVTEIHKVVSRLRSVLLEECKTLTAMIKYLKENVRKKHLIECDQSEPSLSELRELREALQVDLKLFPSSLEALSPTPVKAEKNSFRLPAGQRPDTLRPLTPTSVSRSLAPLSHFKPKPPCGRPPSKTSLFRTHSTHRLTSTSNKSINPGTCNKVNSLGQPNSSLTSEQKTLQSKYHCSLSPEQDGAATLHHRTCLSVHANPPSLETHLSIHSCIQKPITEYSFPLQKERKISSARSTRNIDILPSPAPDFSRPCNAEGYSSSDVDISVSIKGEVRAQNRQQSRIHRGSLELTAVHTDKRLKTKCAENSVISESLAHDDRRKSIDRNNDDSIRKHTNKEQSRTSHIPTDWASHSSERSDAERHNTCPMQPYFSSHKKPHGGPACQSRNGQETKTQPLFSVGFSSQSLQQECQLNVSQ